MRINLKNIESGDKVFHSTYGNIEVTSVVHRETDNRKISLILSNGIKCGIDGSVWDNGFPVYPTVFNSLEECADFFHKEDITQDIQRKGNGN